MRNLRGRAADVATILVAICALVVAGPILLERVRGLADERNRRIEDWERFTESNLRLGPEDPIVTIVEWGDYQCPACRRMAPRLEAVLERFPGKVALVYRHFPLPYHEHAYAAARAAECAAGQDHFAPLHRALLTETDWADDPPESLVSLGASTGIPDVTEFRTCVESEEPHPSVERDLENILELGGSATPTIMVNETLLASLPDSAELDELVQTAMERAIQAP